MTRVGTRQDFLSQFDPQLVQHIERFAERLSVADADLIITMARKATCLVDGLATLGLARPQVPIHSDRILDMDINFLRGKTVKLVDDVIVSGTTLHEATAALEKAGARVVTDVIAVDREVWSRDLVMPREPYAKLSNQASMALCSQIVSAISLIPRPYNVDWPLAALRIKASHRVAVHQISGFAAAEVTSSLQSQHTISVYTATPARWITDALDASFDWPISHLAQMHKVRIYIAPLPAGRDATVRIMPLFSFDSLKRSDLHDLWAAMTSQAPAFQSVLHSSFSSDRSKLRLLQYLVSARLGAAWVNQLQDKIAQQVDWSVETEQAAYIFTPEAAQVACELSASHVPLFTDARLFHSAGAKPRQHQQSLDVPKFNELSLQGRLTQPFIDLYWDKEENARALAQKFGKAALTKPAYKQIMQRLKTGYSMDQLVDIIRRDDRGIRMTVAEARDFVSLWLDIALDAGVAVPVIAEERDTLVRAFRHGEDVHFGEIEEHLCWEMLQRVYASGGVETIPRVIAEKILVIFIRYGVVRGFLQRWEDARLGQPHTVGVRYDLHGAVVKARARELFGDEQGLTLTRRLTAAGRLQIRGEGSSRQPYHLGTVRPADHVPVTRSHERAARTLGAVLGTQLHISSENFDSKDLFTLLATCGLRSDVLAALAAEVNLVQVRLSDLITRVTTADEDPRELLRELRGFINTAANSGKWKYTYGYGPRRSEWISVLREPPEDDLLGLQWSDIVEGIIGDDTQDVDSDVNALVKSLGDWLHAACVALKGLQLRQVKHLTSDEQKTASIRKVLTGTVVEEYLREHPEGHATGLARTLLPAFSDPNAPMHQVEELCVAQLRLLEDLAPALLDETRARSAPHGGLRNLTAYRAALRIELKSPEDAQNYHHIRAIHKVIDSHARGRSSRGQLLTLASANNAHGWTVVCSGRDATKQLAKLAAKLFTQCSSIPGLRIAVVGDLPRNQQLFVGEGSTEQLGEGFYQRMNQIHHGLSQLATTDTYVVFTHPSEVRPTVSAFNDFKQAVTERAAKEQIDYLDGFLLRSEPNPADRTRSLPPTLTPGTFVKGSTMAPSRQIKDRADIGVITVIIPEAIAVEKVLTQGRNYRQSIGAAGLTFSTADVQVARNKKIKIATTKALDPNPVSMSNAYQQLVVHHRPRFIAIVGIAGAIHPDVSLGDVIIANQVIGYDYRKESVNGVERRGESYKTPAVVKRAVSNMFMSSGGSPCELRRLDGSSFVAHEGPIGTGTAVIKQAASGIRAWLQGYNDKVLGVETEAGGVATPFYENSGTDDVEGWVVIRGISDHADVSKDDAWHIRASENAAQALLSLAPHLVTPTTR